MTKTYPWYTPYQFAGNMPIWAKDVDGLEPDPATDDFYIWAGQTNFEIRTELENRVDTYENGSVMAFGHNIPLTTDMLMDDINDSVDGRAWFRGFGKPWASRNLTKYLLGGGGLDIYGYNELDGNNAFADLMQFSNWDVNSAIRNKLENGVDFPDNIRSNNAQSGFNDFSLALGGVLISARITSFSTSANENGDVSYNGTLVYTFFDTYDWGPARRNTPTKWVTGIADHWQLIDLQTTGSEIFYTRAYFQADFQGVFSEDGASSEFFNYQDSFDTSSHLEPQDAINRLPENVETTYDGRQR